MRRRCRRSGKADMVVSILIWLLLLIGSAGLYLWRQDAAVLVLGLTLIAAPLLSILSAALMKKKVCVQIDKPQDVQSGQESMICWSIRNDALLPVAQLRLRVRIENELTGETLRQTVRLQAGGRSADRVQTAFCSRYCGSVRVSMERAELFDLFGLVPFRIPAGEAQRFLLLPEIFEPEIRLPVCMSLSRDSETYSALRPGFDYSETFQVRPYAEGDSPKQVHWKLTSKLDELIVRDPSLPVERMALLFWDRTVREGQTPAQTDALARVLLSVCLQLLRQGVICQLAWNRADENGCMRYELRQDSEIYALLGGLLRAYDDPEKTDGTEQYIRLYGGASGSKVLYFSAQASRFLPALCPEEQLTSFLCTETENGGCGRVYCVRPESCTEDLFEIDLY